MHTHHNQQGKTFYQTMQEAEELDLRDNRGKVHNLALILLGLALALLRNRDGCLSSIHRCMRHTHSSLCTFLGIESQSVVSRSHLPILLQKVNLSVFESLLFTHYGVALDCDQKKWFAADGKELRGSIAKGDKRGEAIVQVVGHSDRAFYNGRKESEKPALRTLLAASNLLDQHMSMDALHLNPATLYPIAQAGGIFLVGLKGNQEELATDMQKAHAYLPVSAQEKTIEKGHGRIEKRQYKAYDVAGQYFDQRWDNCSFSTLIQVERQRIILKTNEQSEETVLFLSNAPIGQAQQLFQSVRQHWAVETSNHVRDVTLKEDKFRTKKTQSQGLWLLLERSQSNCYINLILKIWSLS